VSATTPGDAMRSALAALASTALDYACAPPNESAGRLDLDVRVRGIEALSVMSSWPDYQATPLRSLDDLAAAIGVKSILYKDESIRFGLGSFKPMGAAYALGREIARATGLAAEASFEELRHAVQRTGPPFTACCATDGNHGRAVAWAAQSLGLPCVVFLHKGVSTRRADAIAGHGAQVRRAEGNYDDSVRAAAKCAEANGWRVISDTAYPGFTRTPTEVLCGYLGLMHEIQMQLDQMQLHQSALTHCVAQAGVGGLAAAMFSYFSAPPRHRHRINVCVEPLSAACVLASTRTGERSMVGGRLETHMAGLACGEPSIVAWPIISGCGVHALAIADDAADIAVRLLARSNSAPSGISAGESGAAGLAGLLCAAVRPELKAALGLTPQTVALVIGTEAALANHDCTRDAA
jgi:diaminopropionate ammonia-lyase